MTMATDGFVGFYIETRNYGSTASFWRSLGFQNQFEPITDQANGFIQRAAPTSSLPNALIPTTRLSPSLFSVSPTQPSSTQRDRPTTPGTSNPSTGESSKPSSAIPTAVRSASKHRCLQAQPRPTLTITTSRSTGDQETA